MERKSSSYKDLVYKCLVYLAAVVLIVFFMPSDGKFNYQYDKGKPWRYGQLVAAFDFPIYKDAQLVKQEEDSVLKYFQPYYELDQAVADSQIARFHSDISKMLKVPNSLYINYIDRMLRDIYSAGVISGTDESEMAKRKISGIQVVEKNVASERSLKEVYTVKGAYEYLMNADTLHYSRAVLQQCNLNEYITSNLVYDKEKSEVARNELLGSISVAKGVVLREEKIVDRGEIVTDVIYNKLLSYEKESLKRSDSSNQQLLIWLGQFLFVGILMGAFFIYLELFRRDYFADKRNHRRVRVGFKPYGP